MFDELGVSSGALWFAWEVFGDDRVPLKILHECFQQPHIHQCHANYDYEGLQVLTG